MKCVLRLVELAIILASCACATFSQEELDLTATRRIELARASIVTVKLLDERNQTISQAAGFLVRKDLIATDLKVDRNSRLQITAATKALRVISAGNYFIPYVLVETQTEISPVSLGDSERIAVNDPVYMLSDSGKIVSGRVTGTTTIKNTKAFLMSLAVENNNGAPVFDRRGEVIGIATKSPDVQSAGLAWPSEVLATLKHLGEPGVGVGRGDGPQFGVGAPPVNTDGISPAPRVDTKPVRITSPQPRYTEKARVNGVQGSVLMSVLVGEDGGVKMIRVVRGLPDGLTEQAIAVARETKFKPATKDGLPVAFWVGLEIGFSLR
jgi:TonB family protein